MSATTDPMADVAVACPHCGQRCEILAWVLGRTVDCPKCGKPFEALPEEPKPAPKWTTCRSQRVNLGPPRFEDLRAKRTEPPKPEPRPAPVGTSRNPFSLAGVVWDDRLGSGRCQRCGHVAPPVVHQRILPWAWGVFIMMCFACPPLALLMCVWPMMPAERFAGCVKCKARAVWPERMPRG